MAFFGPKLQLLVVLPQKQFDENEYHEILRACKESKINIVVGGFTTSYPSESMKGLKVKPKIVLGDVEMEDYHGIVFLGGLGAREHFNDVTCHKLARKAVELNRVVGAIDLMPVLLAHAEILRGKKATVHPTEESHITASGANYVNHPVVVDGLIITASDQKVAGEFADVIVGAILRIGV